MSVYLLDDDAGMCAAMAFAFQSKGLTLLPYESPDALLAQISHDQPSCLILDLQLKGTTGIDCLRDSEFARAIDMPVIILTGTGEVTDVVQSMKLGVIDFLEKPAKIPTLIQSVLEALKIDAVRMSQATERRKLKELAALISDREREVVTLISEGLSSKQIARQLGISPNTVANHRARLRQKTGAGSTGELIRLVLLADQTRSDPSAN